MSNELTSEMIAAFEKAEASMRRLRSYVQHKKLESAMPASIDALLCGLPDDAADMFDAAIAEAADDEILKLLLQEAKANRAAAFTN